MGQINLEAADIKQIVSPVAVRANVLTAPDLEAGNMLAKSLSFLACRCGGNCAGCSGAHYPHQPCRLHIDTTGFLCRGSDGCPGPSGSTLEEAGMRPS